MNFKFEDDYDQDDGDFDHISDASFESFQSPARFNGRFQENTNTLKIQINGEVGQKSLDNIREIIKTASQQGAVEIKIRGYNDNLRARLSNQRANLEDEDQVFIETDEEDNQSLSDDAASIASSFSVNSASAFKIVEVNFAKTSDLITLQSIPPLAHKISNFALSKEVMIKLTSKGYQLKGENLNALKEVEAFILKEQSNIIILKVFKDQDPEKIKAVSHSLRNIYQELAKNLGVSFVNILPSNSYYFTYKKLSNKIPALQQKLAQKTQHNNLRIVLYQENIQKDKFNEDRFMVFFHENCKVFKNSVKVEYPEELSPQDKGGLIKLGSKYKLFLKYTPLNCGKLFHIVEAQAYYNTEFERKQLEKKFFQLKKEVIKHIKPRTQFALIGKFAKQKYEKFVLPEIEADLKLKNVTATVVRTGSQEHPGSFKHSHKEYNFAVQIEGSKKNIFAIKAKIAKVMKEVPLYNYEPLIPEQQKKFILPYLHKFENRHFLQPHFKAIEDTIPEIKLMQSSITKSGGDHENGFQGGRGGFRGGRGRGRGGRGRGGNHHHHNGYHNQNAQKEFAIAILYKNQSELNQVTQYFNQLFSKMVSVPLYLKLSELFKKQDMKIEDFKTEYNLIINEFEDKQTQKTKTYLIGDSEQVETAKKLIENLSATTKPIKQTLAIQSNLFMNALKPELKRLIPSEINCRISHGSLHLFGNPTKVNEARTNVENFVNQLSQKIKRETIPNLASSSLKAIQAKPKIIFDWESKNKVKINFIRPTSSKIDLKTGLEDHLKRRLVVVKGDITKIQVNAIANSTNLLFENANIVQGVAKAIVDKAGEEYIEECKDHGELKETQVFTSNSGKLTNCQSIVNVCPPLYSSDANLPISLQKLRLSIQNLLREAVHKRFQTIAVPLFAAGNYGLPVNEAIVCIVEELATGLFKGYNSTLKEIFICEIDEDKLKFLEQKMRSIVGDQLNSYTVQYQWQWLEEGNKWKDYDLEVNRRIDQAFSQKQPQVEVKFPAARAIGSHIVDIPNKTLTRISTGKSSKLERKPDGWYENGVKMNVEVSEIIDLREAQGLKQFQIFITEYLIDFTNSCQINLETKFPRKIQKVPIKSQEVVKSFTIPNVLLIQQSTLHQGKKFGDIIIEGFSESDIRNVKTEINESIAKLMGDKEFYIVPGCGEANIKYLKEEIERQQLKCSGPIQEGKKVVLQGNKMVLFKLEKFFKAIGQVENKQIALPKEWRNIDEENCTIEPLAQNDPEYQLVLQNFSKTLPSKAIVSIKRIQNARFWREYSQEKEKLKNLRTKAGLHPDVKEQHLWHGTRNVHPEVVYAGLEECFDMQYANDGMWGRGLYFAVNSSYSDDYAHPSIVGTKLFMLCRVMVGDTIKQDSDRSIRKAPERLGLKEKIPYESIEGFTGNSVIYILYRMRRAYPEYLIEYK